MWPTIVACRLALQSRPRFPAASPSPRRPTIGHRQHGPRCPRPVILPGARRPDMQLRHGRVPLEGRPLGRRLRGRRLRRPPATAALRSVLGGRQRSGPATAEGRSMVSRHAPHPDVLLQGGGHHAAARGGHGVEHGGRGLPRRLLGLVPLPGAAVLTKQHKIIAHVPCDCFLPWMLYMTYVASNKHSLFLRHRPFLFFVSVACVGKR